MSSIVGDVGVVVGLSEKDLQLGIQRVAQALNELAKTVERMGGQIDKAMAAATSETQKTAKATRELTEEEKKAAEEAKKAAEEKKRLAEEQKKAAEAAKQHQKALSDLRQGMTQIAAAAAAMSAAIVLAGKVALDASKQQEAAMLGLQAVATRTVGSFGEAQKAAETLASDGLLTVVEASKAVQAGLASGFNLEETIGLINAFKDAAAFNRQAGLEYGEAVVRAMEGVRMGNSVLSDAAGITKNLSQILKEAGKSEQDLMKVSSDASVRRALYNGILKEGAIFAGNAAKMTETLAGAEAKAGASAFEAKASIGDSLAPAMQAAYNAATPLLRSLSIWADENPVLARSIFLVVGGATALTAVFAGLTAAALAFNAALGPIGWALVGLTAAAGGLAGLAVSLSTGSDAAQKQKNRLSELVDEHDKLKEALDSGTLSAEESRDAHDRLKGVLEEIKQLNPDLVEGWNLNRDAVADLNAELERLIENERLRQARWKGFWLGIGMYELGQGWTGMASTLLPTERPDTIAGNDNLMQGRRFWRPGTSSSSSSGSSGGGGGGGGGGGTGGSTKQADAFREAMAYVDHLRSMEAISIEEEIAMVQEAARAYADSKEEEWEASERVHQLEKEAREKATREQEQAEQDQEKTRQERYQRELRWIDFLSSVGLMSDQMQIKRLTEILDTFELTEEEKMQLLERRHALEQKIAEDAARAEEERQQAAEEALERGAEAGRDLLAELSEASLKQLEKTQQAEEDFQQRAIDRLRERSEAELDRIRKRQEAEEEAQQERIQGIRDELAELEKKWDAEDRRNQLQELQNQLAAVKADTRYQRVDPATGDLVWTYDVERARELEQQIAEQQQEERRQAQRDELEQRIGEAEDRLKVIQDEHEAELESRQKYWDRRIEQAENALEDLQQEHRREYDERQQFWSDLESLDTAQLAALANAWDQGLGVWRDVFRSQMDEIRRIAEDRAEDIEDALDSISDAYGDTTGLKLPTPGLPRSLGQSITSTNNATANVTVNVTGAKDPQSTANLVRTAAKTATESALMSALLTTGRVFLRTGQ